MGWEANPKVTIGCEYCLFSLINTLDCEYCLFPFIYTLILFCKFPVWENDKFCKFLLKSSIYWWPLIGWIGLIWLMTFLSFFDKPIELIDDWVRVYGITPTCFEVGVTDKIMIFSTVFPVESVADTLIG